MPEEDPRREFPLGPTALLAAVVLGLSLFVALVYMQRSPLQIAVSQPHEVSLPQCQAPCFSVRVTNSGGQDGNVTCWVGQQDVFTNGSSVYTGLTPLEPGQTWTLYVKAPSDAIPAPDPAVRCQQI